MFLADFHMHTNISDGKIPIEKLVDMHGERGFGAIAITDHLCERGTFLGNWSRYLGFSLTKETFPDYMKLVKKEANRAWREYKMIVLPGYEITKNFISNQRSAHMLAVGTEHFVDPNAGVIEACAEIRAHGGLAIAAHPVSTRKWEKQTYFLWDQREKLRHSFDAWEVASGPYIFDEVLTSGLPMIANSDMHVPRQIKSWKTALTCEKDPEAILDAVRRQDMQFCFYADDRVRHGLSKLPIDLVPNSFTL